MSIEPFYEVLGRSIRVHRRRAGLSQASLGSRVGLTRQSVANIENAKQRVLAHTLAQLEQVLGARLTECRAEGGE